jgi:FAD/FMN-containing dehydrogenase
LRKEKGDGLKNQLTELLGRDCVSDDPEILAAHSGDKWIAAQTPEVVVFAKSPNDVSNLLKFASRQKIPVTARGAFADAHESHQRS